MTVYALMGIPFGSRKQHVLRVYEQESDAISATEQYEREMYSDVEIEEVDFCENYIDNSLDFD